MGCQGCQAQVPADARFCPACGAPQALKCPSCGADNARDSQFCKDCGKQLTPPEKSQRDGLERRSMTILFCDLVESVPLSNQLDPEELREVLDAYHLICGRAAERFEGFVAQYLGDGVVVYFGYPVAHEDDARRSILAGLAILEQAKGLAEHWRANSAINLRLRIGIHTGFVVVGQIGQGEHVAPQATGDAPNLAARIQGLAAPDSIVVSEDTYALVRGYFSFEALPRTRVKGVDAVIQPYRVLGETGGRARFAAESGEGLLPFFGREDVLDTLLQAWAQASKGKGQTVLLRGEAGIGKSRILRALSGRACTPEQLLVAECSPFLQASAFAPTIEFIEDSFGIDRDALAAEKTARLMENMAQWPSANPQEATALIAVLLQIEAPPEIPKLNLSLQAQRQGTIETLVELTLGKADSTPLIVVFEDVHWADPSTLELLDEFVARATKANILLLLTCRPEFKSPWSGRPGVREIVLDALAEDAASKLVSHILAGSAMTDVVKQRLVQRAEGNPLFLEEITRAILTNTADSTDPDADADAGIESQIPPTLRETLLARINRLGADKRIAQLGAAIGRNFSRSLITAVSDLPAAELEAGLAQLVDDQLLIRSEAGLKVEYSFKHALIQDAAYETMLNSRRREIHKMIGQTLVEQFQEIYKTQPEVPARHFTEAGLNEQAIELWCKAAEQAQARSAFSEADSHLFRALKLVRKSPPSPERSAAELGLLMTLGPIQMATRGFADSRVEQTFEQARDICHGMGNIPQMAPVLNGLWAFHVVRADLRIAHELAQQILNVVATNPDSGIELEGHRALGITHLFSGNFKKARDSLNRALSIYQPELHRAQAETYGWESGMACHLYLAKASSIMGESDTAREHLRQAQAIADATDHSHSWARCMADSLHTYNFIGDKGQLLELSPRLMLLAQEQGFPLWAAHAEIFSGCAILADEPAAAIKQIERGLEQWVATGTKLYLAQWKAKLASALSLLDRHREALEQAEAALELELDGEEQVSLADLHRQKAEVMFRAGRGDPWPDLLSAIRIARDQGAGLWELRALLLADQIAASEGRREKTRHELVQMLESLKPFGSNADMAAAREWLRD